MLVDAKINSKMRNTHIVDNQICRCQNVTARAEVSTPNTPLLSEIRV